MFFISSRAAMFGVVLGITAGRTAAVAQTSSTAAFVTTVGSDTVAVEQYGREGNTIRGVWATKTGSSGAQLFYYEILLGADGAPTRYSVLMRPAGSTVPAAKLPSVTIQYGRDTAVFSMEGDASMTKRIAMSGAFPRLGSSVVGIELAISRVRAAGVDASTIVVNSPLGPSFDAIKLPVLFVRPDSVQMTKDLVAKLDGNGRLVQLHDATRETRRAESADVGAVVDEWMSGGGDKPGIQMSLSELQRFVGHYSLGADVQISVERIGAALQLHTSDGALELVAQSANRFKVRGEAGFVEFERNAAGDVTALVLVNDDKRQRAPRTK
ncbi:MAG: hypothetical protein ABI442_21300 [Gemmatimonadaceae bacterium]